MKRSSVAVLMCLIAGCAGGPENKPVAVPSQPRAQSQTEAPAATTPAQRRAPAPAAPVAPAVAPSAPPPPSASGGQGADMVSGTVTKIGKEMEVLELQTPSGWSQFIVTDPERKKELQQVTAGEKVDVKVQVQGGERKVIAVLRRNPPAATPVQPK